LALKGLDLFAGAGGMSLGMQWAGIDVVGGIEYNPHAVAAYKYNLGDHVVCADIKEFSPEDMEAYLVERGSIRSSVEIDVVFGGPPCPGFSNIGRSKISSLIKSGEWEGSDHRHKFIDDERNELFREFVKYVEHFEPQVFVMENVKGMKSYETKKHGTIVDIIEAEFRRLGYEVEVDVMDSAGFGVAQNRQRLIFMGTRKASQLTHPHPAAWAISLSDVIADLPSIDPLTGASTGELLESFKNIRGSKRRKQALRYLRKQALPRERPRNSLALQEHRTRQVNPRDQAIFPLLQSGENGPRVLYKHVYPDMLNLVKKNLPRGYAMAGKRKGYVVYKKGEPDTNWKWYDASSFGDKMRRLKLGEPSPTVVAHLAKDGYMFVHPTENRTISILEAARIQSFPDGFDFSAGGTIAFSHQMRQIGNAVPPLMALAIGVAIMQHLGRHPLMTLEDVYPTNP
jgi:DNA (cytosine-5)-methyltransferase 1